MPCTGTALSTIKPKKEGGDKKMQLLTKEIKEKLPALYAQEQVKDPIVHV